jgi:hypothetical protein
MGWLYLDQDMGVCVCEYMGCLNLAQGRGVRVSSDCI